MPSGNTAKGKTQAKERATGDKGKDKSKDNGKTQDKGKGQPREKGQDKHRNGKEELLPTIRTSVSPALAPDAELHCVRRLRRRHIPGYASWRRVTRVGILRHRASHGMTLHGTMTIGCAAQTIGRSLSGKTRRGHPAPNPCRERGRRHLRQRFPRPGDTFHSPEFFDHARVFLGGGLSNHGLFPQRCHTFRPTCRRRSSATSTR